MVKVTAIRLNIIYIKITIILFLLAYILLVFFNSQDLINNIIKGIDTEFLVLSFEKTLIINKDVNTNTNIWPKWPLSFNKLMMFLLGFDITEPQTILACQINYINSDTSFNNILVAESSIFFDENSEELLLKNADPEIKPIEDITNIKGIRLINETKYEIDIQSYIDRTLKFPNKKGKKKVLIYQTHSCESYKPSEKYDYIPSDNDRTNDMNFSVVKVGEQLAKILKDKYKIEVVHDKTIHDIDAYDRAYTKSASTLQKYLDKHKEFDMVIDIHRDALMVNGEKLRAVTAIDDKECARVMAVVGSNSMGLPHPNWKDNLSLGIKFINKMNNYYPGLSRGVNLKTGRFNQYLSSKSILLEVGANGNTLDEALNTTEYLAHIISEVINN